MENINKRRYKSTIFYSYKNKLYVKRQNSITYFTPDEGITWQIVQLPVKFKSHNLTCFDLLDRDNFFLLYTDMQDNPVAYCRYDFINKELTELPPLPDYKLFIGMKIKSVDKNTAYYHAHYVDTSNGTEVYRSKLYKTTDGLLTWNNILEGTEKNGQYFNNFDIYGNNLIILSTTLTNNISYTRDGGKNWKNTKVVGIDENEIFNSTIVTIASPNSFYMSDIRGRLYKYEADDPTILDEIQSENNNFHIYPNPVLDNISINFINNSFQNIRIKMIDLLGNIQIEKKLNILNMGENTININLAKKLATGLYILQIFENESYKHSEKIIVN